MKLKNISSSVREIKSVGGWKSLVGPKEIIELSNPILDSSTLRSFKIIKEKTVKKNAKEDIIE